MSVAGIDVSNNNDHDIDWKKLRASGVRFVYFKVNEGDWYDPVTTAARVRHAKSAGLLVGGYNFIRPRAGRRGSQEFDLFYKRAKEVGLLDKGCLRPVIDVEATLLSPLGTRRYVRSWIRRATLRTKVRPVIYTGQWFWDGIMHGNKYTTLGCKLWLAAYVPEADMKKFLPRGFDHVSIWQYTSTGTAAGVNGHVDRNKYLGQLKTFENYRL